MTTYDPAEVERLVREAREDDHKMAVLEGHERAPWRSVEATRNDIGRLRHYVTCIPADHACWSGDDMAAWSRLGIWTSDGVTERAFADGISRTRNNLGAMADQLDAARARIGHLERGIDGAIDVAATWVKYPTDFENLNLFRKIRDGWWPPTGTRPVGQMVRELESARAGLAAATARIAQLTETARTASENWMSACRQRDEARAALREACRMLRGCRSGEHETITTTAIETLLAVADGCSPGYAAFIELVTHPENDSGEDP